MKGGPLAAPRHRTAEAATRLDSTMQYGRKRGCTTLLLLIGLDKCDLEEKSERNLRREDLAPDGAKLCSAHNVSMVCETKGGLGRGERTVELVHHADPGPLFVAPLSRPVRVPVLARRTERHLVEPSQADLLAPALVVQDAVAPVQRVRAADVERRVVDKVEGRDGRGRGGDVRDGFVEECCRLTGAG